LLDIVLQLSRVEPVPTRPLAAIDGIAIHHSGDEGSPAGWARYHTTTPEVGGPSWGPATTIGYHAAVMRDGTTYKTARDSDQTPGVANENFHLLHVVNQGNLAQTPPTAAQIRALLEVLHVYMAAYAIPVDRVRTHGEWQTDPAWATSCPGISDLGKHIRFMLTIGF